MSDSARTHRLDSFESEHHWTCVVKEASISGNLHLFDQAIIHQWSLKILSMLVVVGEPLIVIHVLLEALSEGCLTVGTNISERVVRQSTC